MLQELKANQIGNTCFSALVKNMIAEIISPTAYFYSMDRLILLLSLFTFCACSNQSSSSRLDPAEYLSSIEEWHQRRITSLKAPDGWLNLAGLYWLKEGLNTFGTGENMDIHFPDGSVPASAGYFILESNRVSVYLKPEAAIKVNGVMLKESVVFHADSSAGKVMETGDFRWVVIRREDKFGIRLRQLNHPRLEKFSGIERFPIDQQFRITARFQVADTLRYIPITNVLGQTTLQYSPGTLVFEWENKTRFLDVIDEGNGGDYFIVFADETTGKTTYSGGRFLYVSRPDQSGEITIDFNKAINPPCVFSPFATCPLPPKQNQLDFSVLAGEKNFHLD